MVLQGYASGFAAEDPFGNPLETETVPVAAKRWPWRLASYLGNDLAALYSDGTRLTPGLNGDQEYSEVLYEVSAYPSFGLNSLFVGGDENYGGFSEIFQEDLRLVLRRASFNGPASRKGDRIRDHAVEHRGAW